VRNLGQAAHIRGASPEGPRSDKSITRQDRISIHNAIWLCLSCARKIDLDESVFTIELLKNWKTRAEIFTDKRAGLPLERDRSVEVLTQALTGKGNEIICSSIANVSQVAKEILEKENPGLQINPNYVDGIVVHQISAKPGANVKPIFFSPTDPTDASDLLEKVNKGLPFEGKYSFRIKSPYPILNLKNLHLSFKPDTHEGELRLFASEKPEEDLEIPIQIHAGLEQLFIKGNIGDATIELSQNINGPTLDCQCSIAIVWKDCSMWEGKDIRALPNFRKLDRLFRIIYETTCELEIYTGGEVVLKYSQPPSPKMALNEQFDNIRQIVAFAQNLNLNCEFSLKQFLSMDIHGIHRYNLAFPSGIFTESADSDSEYHSLFTSRILPDGGKIEPVMTLKAESQTINFFGRRIVLPASTITIEGTCEDAGMFDDKQRLKISRRAGSSLQIVIDGPAVVDD